MSLTGGINLAPIEVQIKANIENFKNGMNQMVSAAQAAAQNTENKFSALSNIGGKLTSIGTTLTNNVTKPILEVGATAVKTAANFDSAMSKVGAISGATGDDMQRLRDKALEMGSKTQFSAKESADAFTYMAMAGWKTEDMLNGISGIMDLAAASGEDLATTSDIVTDALTAFGLTAQDSSHFADVLASASSNANTNVSLLGESFKYVAPVCGSLGYSAEDTSIALGLMANAGIKGSAAGTALRSSLVNMIKPTDTMANYMDKLKLSITDSNGNIKQLKPLMDELREKFKGLTDAQKDEYAAAIFGKLCRNKIEQNRGKLSIINIILLFFCIKKCKKILSHVI